MFCFERLALVWLAKGATCHSESQSDATCNFSRIKHFFLRVAASGTSKSAYPAYNNRGPRPELGQLDDVRFSLCQWDASVRDSGVGAAMIMLDQDHGHQ